MDAAKRNEERAAALTFTAFGVFIVSFFGQAWAGREWDVFLWGMWRLALLTAIVAGVVWARLKRRTEPLPSNEARRLERRSNFFAIAGLLAPFAVYWMMKLDRGYDDGWGSMYAAVMTVMFGIPLGVILVGIGFGYGFAAKRRRRADSAKPKAPAEQP